ncbi:hypothetical protein SpCBS45565_g04809 [Spizellomyces sp. 'palustris']|nr:hypothetical protein SpCBS45565_g04809 [Spizellomyces sp. 'palustris']
MKATLLLATSAVLALNLQSAAAVVKFTTENQLPSLYTGAMYNNFVSSQNGTIIGAAGINIPWRYFAAPGGSVNTIVLVNGHTESFIKFRELIYDFNQNGFNVFTWDHRGQGFSNPRLGCQPDTISDVDQFQNYVNDMQALISVVTATSPKNLFLWGHSMGGGIGAMYLEQFPNTFRAALLTAPMLQINTDPYSNLVAFGLAGTIGLLQGPCALLPGQTATPAYVWSDEAFVAYNTTSSRVRFNLNMQSYANFPETQIAGIDARWMTESMSANAKTVQNAKKAKTPILLYQAGMDAYVEPEGQNTFCQGSQGFLGISALAVQPAPNCNLVKWPTSRHEIFNEVDSIRGPAFTQGIEFFLANAK